MPNQVTLFGLALSGINASRTFKNCKTNSNSPFNCFFNVPNIKSQTRKLTTDCSICCPKSPVFLSIPNKPIINLGISFRTIARQLCAFKQNLMSYPLSKEFLSDPYHQTADTIFNLDRLWNRLANQFVNDLTNVTQGFGKRILFCSNDGRVFIDVSTFKQGTRWQNFNMVAINKESNYKYIASPQQNDPQYNINITNNSITFNHENINITSLTNNGLQQAQHNQMLKCGSNDFPATDPNNLEPQNSVATTFLEEPLHTGRKEILQAMNSPYGWCSRYSETIFSPNYYVATKLEGNDGYGVFIRLSYFSL